MGNQPRQGVRRDQNRRQEQHPEEKETLQPPVSSHRKRDFDTMSQQHSFESAEHNDDPSSIPSQHDPPPSQPQPQPQTDPVLESLQEELSRVEESLEEQQQSRQNSVFRWPVNHNGASARPSEGSGRAVFDSLGSALDSIRRRFQQYQRQHEHTDNRLQSQNLPPEAETDAPAAPPVPSPQEFSERLQTAELAHSTRMPLGILRQQRSHSQSASTSMATSPERFAGKTDKNDDSWSDSSSHSGSGGGGGRTYSSSTSSLTSAGGGGSGDRGHHRARRTSALLASRRHAAQQETNEIAVHEDGTAWMGSNHQEGIPEIQGTPQQQHHHQHQQQKPPEEDDSRPASLVLPAASFQKMTKNLQGLLGSASSSSAASVASSYSSPVKRSKSAGTTLVEDTSTSPEPEPAEVQREEEELHVEAPANIYSWGTCTDFDLFGEQTQDSSQPLEPTTQPKLIPATSRVGRSDVVSMSFGASHAALATLTGSMLICGNNAEGAVNPMQKSERRLPRPMHLESILSLTTRVLQVSCGLDHTAILTDSHSVLTFGNNMDGQLGHRLKPNMDFRQNNRFQPPAAMVLPRRAAKVVCGHRFTLVLTTRMEVYICGREELTGHSTLHGEMPRLPEQHPALQGLPMVQIAAGHQHAVVVTSQGTAYAWGANPTGACGRGFPKVLTVPVPIQVPASKMEQPNIQGKLRPAPFSNWAAWEVAFPNMITLAEDVSVIHAACGKDTTVLVTKLGRLLVAGSNDKCQLGLGLDGGDEKAEISPVQTVDHPSTGTSFVSAQAGDEHVLLLDSQGDVWMMGNGKVLRPVLQGKSIVTIAAGGTQNLAISSKKSTQETFEASKDDKGMQTTLSASATTPGLEGLLDGILLEKDLSKQENAVRDLANQTEELFRCPAVMNSVFLDPKEIDDMYGKLISAAGEKKYRQQVVSAMEKGMVKGLEDIKDARLMYPESVRCLLLYLQCPLFRAEGDGKIRDVEFDPRGETILHLCETILGLPFEGYKALTAWSTSIYAKELFVPYLVKPLIDQLNARIQAEQTRAVPAIVGVLRWFQNVAERFDDEVIAMPEDFHSSGVANLPMEALFEDLVRYKRASKAQRSTNFFLAASPFLLSPGAKRNLLQVENQMTMVRAAQEGGVRFDIARRQFLFNPYFVLAIDRPFMLQQTLQAVAMAAPGELRKSLKVVFKGEEGVDAGGVAKEFFQLLVVQLFDINTGMWSTQLGDGVHTWFNADCTWNQDGYYLVGILVGLAVYNGVLLDVHFPQTVYRKLLGLPLGLEDMVDPEIKRGLQSLLDYGGDVVEDVFCLTFEVNWNSLGMERKQELKPGGANIAVTSDNKEEYVMLYTKFLLVDSIQDQYNEFERGFMQVMEGSSLDLLRPEELELLVVGTPELNFDALEANAEYEGGYDKDSPVVKHLWRFVKESPRETQLMFLKFATGSTKAPIGGLGEMPFKIQRNGSNSMQLPSSHTCFNTLLVPDYGDDYDKLKERMGRAIIECEGFGLQ